MIPHWRKKHIEEALKKTKSLVDAANGDSSVCACFDIKPFNTHWDKKTVEEIKSHVRLYLDTWVIPELKKALQNKQYL